MRPAQHAVLTPVSAWFAHVFASLEDLNTGFCEELASRSRAEDDALGLAREGRDPIRRLSRQYLRRHAYADGAGLIFARPTRGDKRGVIEWWERDGGRGASRYSFGVNPSGDRFYDYEELEWFQRSFASGEPWLTGPYIDYLGVDKYVVTLTTPSLVHDRAVGVTAVDITMESLERELLPLLDTSPDETAVLSAHGSVLTGNGSRFLAGDIVETAPDGYDITPLGGSSHGVTLLHPAAG